MPAIEGRDKGIEACAEIGGVEEGALASGEECRAQTRLLMNAS
jgi:hypothetical protein